MVDLNLLTIGMVTDMIIERSNDSYDYDDEEGIREASQADFDRF